ncbi:MAG: AAA family ATPase, partial [Acidimicrobiales bacterium]
MRGLPRTGKTLLARAVADLLGETAFYFDGATITEDNQAEEHARLQAEVDSRVNTHDCAQLVFDGYGRAVRRSRGAILHSQLYGQLIDGDRSRDIGAIFTSRYADALDIKVSGSPLLGRVTSFELPRLTEEDAATLGLDLEVARSYFGDLTAFAHIALNAEPAGAPDG